MHENISVLVITPEGSARIDRHGDEPLTRLGGLLIALSLVRQSPFGIAVTVVADGAPIWAGEPFPLCEPSDVPFLTSLITRIIHGRANQDAA